jgi:membrane-associated phospholipid phosphatase
MTSTDARAHQQTRARRLGRAAAYGVVVAAVFFTVGFLVRSKWDPLINADEAAFLPRNLYAIGTVLCLWVWLRKGLRTRAWWAFGTMMVAWFIEYAAKLVFQRARPVVEDPVSKAPGFSFPSGHALGSAAFFTTAVLLLWPIVTSRVWRGVMVTVSVVLVVLTALDRTFLGVHYPSDVTVGVVTGAGLVLASYAGYARWNPRDREAAHDPDLDPRPGDDDIADDRHTAHQER